MNKDAFKRWIWIVLLVFVAGAGVAFIFWMKFKNESNVSVVLSAPFPVDDQESYASPLSFPDTSDGVHVFNDQLAIWEMTEAQYEFAATHYDGTQKVFASDARRLRAYNPNFIVLNYRLGLGLGYRKTNDACQPDGDWFEIIEGEKWTREYPDNANEEWFFKRDGKRVLFCDWGWHLMDIANASWKEYWYAETLRQTRANLADGIFADAMSVPNYFGGSRFDPPLPDLDIDFETAWSKRIEDFIAFAQSGEMAKYSFIVNAGAWINGRDVTDYSNADGVMIEGFARWSDGSYFSVPDDDWRLQMDRILSLINKDRILLLQQYIDPANTTDRTFLLANYLLVKGRHTYFNLEFSSTPEWLPEYGIPIGVPADAAPSTVSALWRSDWNLYARSYSAGLVLVNPTDATQNVELGATFYQAMPNGGGVVPTNGDVSSWVVDYVPVTNVTLAPNQGAILLFQKP